MKTLTKTIEIPSENLMIKYIEGGRIIFYHMDTKKPTGKIINYSKSAINSIGTYIENQKKDTPLHKSVAQINKVGSEILSEFNSMELHANNTCCFAKPNKNKTSEYKMYNRGGGKQISLKSKTKFFERRMRYMIDFCVKSKNVEFIPLEPISAENFFMTYEEPVLTIY